MPKRPLLYSIARKSYRQFKKIPYIGQHVESAAASYKEAVLKKEIDNIIQNPKLTKEIKRILTQSGIVSQEIEKAIENAKLSNEFIGFKVLLQDKLSQEEIEILYQFYLSQKESSESSAKAFWDDLIAFSKGAPLTIDVMEPKLPQIISKLTQNPIDISALYTKDSDVHTKAELKSYCDARIHHRIEKRHQEFKSRTSNFSPSLANEAYLDIKNLLDTRNIPFFLISGTLLGAIREGDFLKNDYDIDLGFYAWDIEVREIKEAILHSKQFFISEYDTENLLRIKHTNGILIDLYSHCIEHNALCHQTPHHKWYNTPFGLTSISFAGSTANIPDNYDLYLSENYGNWRDEICFYDFSFDTPNVKYPKTLESLEYFSNRMISGVKNTWRRQFVCTNKALNQAFDLDFMHHYPSMADGDIMDNYGMRLQLLVISMDSLEDLEHCITEMIEYVEGSNIRLDVAIHNGTQELKTLIESFDFIHGVFSYQTCHTLDSDTLSHYDKILTDEKVICDKVLMKYPLKKIILGSRNTI